jgi:hypothetical protein
MTIFNRILDDWKNVKNHCRTTVSKEFTEVEPTEKFKKQLLISEHSPIRLLEFDWSWRNIPYWVSTEWSRHKFEKFISSQRNDRQDKYDRNEARQDSPVNMDCYANEQNLIDVFRKRLCCQATEEARSLAEDFKRELSKTHKLESDVLVPNCVYRGGCPEIKKCGYWKKFLTWCKENYKYIETIQDRYDAYNEYFEEING